MLTVAVEVVLLQLHLIAMLETRCSFLSERERAQMERISRNLERWMNGVSLPQHDPDCFPDTTMCNRFTPLDPLRRGVAADTAHCCNRWRFDVTAISGPPPRRSTSLVINGAVFLIVFLSFCWLRRKHPMVYAPPVHYFKQ